MNVDSKVAKQTLDNLDKLIYNHKKMVLSTIYSMYLSDSDIKLKPSELYDKFLK
jgi:hypothetical protein